MPPRDPPKPASADGILDLSDLPAAIQNEVRRPDEHLHHHRLSRPARRRSRRVSSPSCEGGRPRPHPDRTCSQYKARPDGSGALPLVRRTAAARKSAPPSTCRWLTASKGRGRGEFPSTRVTINRPRSSGANPEQLGAAGRARSIPRAPAAQTGRIPLLERRAPSVRPPRAYTPLGPRPAARSPRCAERSVRPRHGHRQAHGPRKGRAKGFFTDEGRALPRPRHTARGSGFEQEPAAAYEAKRGA